MYTLTYSDKANAVQGVCMVNQGLWDVNREGVACTRHQPVNRFDCKAKCISAKHPRARKEKGNYCLWSL